PLGFGVGTHGSFLLAPSLSGFGGANNNQILASTVRTRDSVFNIHIGFPHKIGTKDDLQLLGQVNNIQELFYDSANDMGGMPLLNGPLGATVGGPNYFDGYQ